MKKITNVTLDTTSLPSEGGDRTFNIKGDVGAVFTIYAYNEDGSYYNFATQDFRTLDGSILRRGQSYAEYFLTKSIGTSGVASGNIKFPSVTDDDIYEVFVRAEPGLEAEIDGGSYKTISGETKFDESFDNEFIYHVPNNDQSQYTIEDQTLNTSNIAGTKKFTSSIHQFVDTTITFSLLHSSSDVVEPSNYTITLPRYSTYAPGGLQPSTGRYNEIDVDWEITVPTSTFFVARRQPTIDDFETSVTINTQLATASGSPILTLTRDTTASVRSLLLLSPGTKASATNIPADTTIKTIDKENNQVTLSANTTDIVAADTAVTFTETGSRGADIFFDSAFSISDFKIALSDVEIATDDTSTNQVVPLANTNGLKTVTTQTVNGAITSKNVVVLDAVTGLFEGQKLVAVSSGSLTGVPEITSISTSGKRVTLSTPQTFADGITLTFANSIITGIGISRSGTAPTYVDGISAGASVTAKRSGSNVTNSLVAGQTIKFVGSSMTATITGKIKVLRVGDTNFTTTLNLDNLLTVG
tara:strand:- start:2949 stop:4535 length:1587 start_codon:yes stop_codon:yes gene_type:complete